MIFLHIRVNRSNFVRHANLIGENSQLFYNSLPNMLALYAQCFQVATYYAKNYASIIGLGLILTSESFSCFDLYKTLQSSIFRK